MFQRPSVGKMSEILQAVGKQLVFDINIRKQINMLPRDSFEMYEVSKEVVKAVAPDLQKFLKYIIDLKAEGYIGAIRFCVPAKGITPETFKDAKDLSDEDLEVIFNTIGQNAALKERAIKIQHDVNYLHKKVVEAVNNKEERGLDLEKIYLAVGNADSVFAKYTKVIRGFAAASLVPLLYAGVRKFAFNSNFNSIPYLACTTALLCFTGLASSVIKSAFNKAEIRNCNNIKVQFADLGLATKIWNVIGVDRAPSL